MRVETLLNVEYGSRFWAYKPGAALVPGPTVDVPELDPDADVLDFVWVVGNRMDPSIVWPPTTRSLSVGDVVVVPGDGAYAVANIGWERVSPRDLYLSRLAGRGKTWRD